MKRMVHTVRILSKELYRIAPDATAYDVLARLAAYEARGLLPEQIDDLRADNERLCDALGAMSRDLMFRVDQLRDLQAR